MRVLYFLLITLLALPTFADDLFNLPEQPVVSDGIAMLQQMGLAPIFPKESYRGDEPVTKEELASVVARMIQYFEAALPKEIALQEVSQSAVASLKQLRGDSAIDFLMSNNVSVPDTILHRQAQPATVDETALLIADAFSYLIERIVPPPDDSSEDSPDNNMPDTPRHLSR